MEIPENVQIHQSIFRTLTNRSRGAHDASAIADASVVIWGEVAVALAPIIGEGGVDALFNRSLYLAAREYPWLAGALETKDSLVPVPRFWTNLQTRDANSAMAAGSLLMVIFYGLLERLIGKKLTGRLLLQVWRQAAESLPKENAQ